MKKQGVATLAQLREFDEVIDARSPAEFAEDHIPGAINRPVLDDEERARVGTIYKQVNSFEAKKIGAVIASRNIARHIESDFVSRVKGWRPLVYCWRGGSRSGAMVTVLRAIGWDAAQLEGGHKAYRRAVVAELAELPGRFRLKVISGATGTGKSRVLAALRSLGEQVVDLEALAKHRGSVLGDLPDQAQPSQKFFDSLLWNALRDLDPARAVYVESESRKVGRLAVPAALIDTMHRSPTTRIEADVATRVALLLGDYAHFLSEPEALRRQLDCLVRLHGRARIEEWKKLAESGTWDMFVERLLIEHYDPAYHRSLARNYGDVPAAAVRLEAANDAAIEAAARRIAAA